MYFVKYGREYLHDPRIDGRMLLDLKLDCEENSCGYCDFTIYPDHPMYDKLKERDADNPIEVYDNDVLLFAGFIYELGKEFYLDGHVKCKGDLDYLSDSIIRPYSTVNTGYGLKAPDTVKHYFEWLIDQHNKQASLNKRFVVGANEVSALCNYLTIFEENLEYPTVINEIIEKLINVYGGYLVVRHENGVRYIDYLSEWRDSNSQVLDFGVNLTDYTQTDDSVDVSTFVIPLGVKMSETEYDYDDGYFATEDTSVNSSKEYYTETGDGYTKCENLTSFQYGVLYFESDEYGYFVTEDTTPQRVHAVETTSYTYTALPAGFHWIAGGSTIIYERLHPEVDADYYETDDTEAVEGKTYYTRRVNVTSETTGTDKQYYTRNPEILGYSKCNEDLSFFKNNVTYYEYDETEDESDLPLTIKPELDRRCGDPDYIKLDDCVYNEDAVKKYGWIGCVYKNEDIFTRDQLISAGIIALKERVAPKRTIEIKAVDMHLVNPSIQPIRIGEYVRVRSKPHHLDSYFLCANIDLDLNNPENSLYTLGTTFDTLTGQQNKKINELNASINSKYTQVETSLVNNANERSDEATRIAGNAYAKATEAATAAIAAKNTADSATARVTIVESQVTTAQVTADQAISAAGTASALANQIHSEISDVVGDAESLRDAIEGQIETKVSTMTANYTSTTDLTTVESTLQTAISESAAGVETRVEQTYAKKTDLTSAETDIWTALRQNSSSISTVASEVTTVQANIDTAQNAATTAQNLANAAQQSADAAGTSATTAQQAAAAAQAAANQAQADVDAIESLTTTRLTSVEQTANGVATRITAAETTISNLQSSVTSQFLEVEETATGITARVGTVENDLSHLTYGGRNLCLGSRNFEGSWGNLEYWTETPNSELANLVFDDWGELDSSTWSNVSSASWVDLVNKIYSYKEYSRIGSWMGIYQAKNVIAGCQYTFSFYAKGDSSTNIHVYTDWNSESTTPDYIEIGSITTDHYTRYSSTFTANITGTIYPRVENTVDSLLQICAIKFEEGNKPTDWTPAPEDAENAIVDAKKCATDYISFSSDGLTVGDMTAEELGENVNISGTGIKLRTGSTTIAEFTPTTIDFEQPVVFKADGIMLDNGDAFSNLGRNNILWTHATGKWMTDSITLNANITRQVSGAVFAWSYFQNGAPQNTNWRYFFVPKAHVTNHPGDGIYMTDPYLGINKYVYVSNSIASGVASNSQSGTTNGIAWNNANYVLRYVIGV